MSALAKLVLEFDALWPGEPDESMELPAEEWARLVALAKIADAGCAACGFLGPQHIAALKAQSPKPYRVAVVACSASKLKGTHAAKDLYTGQLFKLARELAEKVADRWVILSARHGLITPNGPVDSYDLRIEDASDGWGIVAATDFGVVLEGIAPEQVLCLAPETYVSKLPVGFAKGWARPLKGKGIGQQKAELKRLLGGGA